MQQMDTDYLVIGSGTAGLAFVDTLLAEGDAHITIVDRHGKPGGHWNDAYPFVTLHQPSAVRRRSRQHPVGGAARQLAHQPRHHAERVGVLP